MSEIFYDAHEFLFLENVNTERGIVHLMNEIMKNHKSYTPEEKLLKLMQLFSSFIPFRNLEKFTTLKTVLDEKQLEIEEEFIPEHPYFQECWNEWKNENKI